MTASDPYSSTSEALSDPCDQGFAISPHDSNELTVIPRGIYVGVGGDIVLITKADVTHTFKSVPTGSILPFRPKIVKSTSTTATNLIGIY